MRDFFDLKARGGAKRRPLLFGLDKTSGVFLAPKALKIPHLFMW